MIIKCDFGRFDSSITPTGHSIKVTVSSHAVDVKGEYWGALDLDDESDDDNNNSNSNSNNNNCDGNGSQPIQKTSFNDRIPIPSKYLFTDSVIKKKGPRSSSIILKLGDVKSAGIKEVKDTIGHGFNVQKLKSCLPTSS